MCCCHIHHHLVLQQLALPKAGIRHDSHAKLTATAPQRRLRVMRVALHLVHHWQHRSGGAQLLQVPQLVVAHPNGSAPPLLIHRLQHLPRLLAHAFVFGGGEWFLGHAWPVNEQHVDVV
eukprot:CAMPEP_0177761628 /NCGR_PEP_ID=MMETSP0491_2-20121128/5907_1 /TAXON_ID=63592 /ORGANISM="Tetraselmis chuii, Strain PLY429" /LENGTH=118 /DNA_ID=CAMNT_0019277617 /DNA_START=343 /DNA_END=699 /DNA_ORIENTATION=-